jgi:hypothetical protein
MRALLDVNISHTTLPQTMTSNSARIATLTLLAFSVEMRTTTFRFVERHANGVRFPNACHRAMNVMSAK